jgi:YD repeat-containing protein
MTKGGLTTSATYNGYGGVKLTHVDPSGNTTTYGYSDPWNRVTSIQDPLGNTVYKTYSATSLTNDFAFGSSVNNVTTTLDGYGRAVLNQKQQAPSSSNWDTVSTTYNFGGVQPTVYTSIPCTQSAGNPCSGTAGVTKSYDMLGRLVNSADGGGGTDAITYTQNDVLSQLGPPSPNENAKQVQSQYDGLGRLTSTCKISSTVTGSISCGQNTNTSILLPRAY